VEPKFHPDSYGSRSGKSALDAVGVARERCWRQNWCIDLDIKAFFDTLDHELMMKAIRFHTSERWIHLYVERWLKAPLQKEDGSKVARDFGTPQGGLCKALHNPPYAKKKIMQSNWTYASKNMNLDLIYSA
jgi:RNA-directed DNA polymerase